MFQITSGNARWLWSPCGAGGARFGWGIVHGGDELGLRLGRLGPMGTRTPDTITQYSGQVLANLQGPGRLHALPVRLMSPSSGMAGGGVGSVPAADRHDHQRAVPAALLVVSL